MLVLSRKKNEVITVDLRQFGLPPLELVIVEIRGDKVRVGVKADDSISINRQEVFESKEREREQAGLPEPGPERRGG